MERSTEISQTASTGPALDQGKDSNDEPESGEDQMAAVYAGLDDSLK